MRKATPANDQYVMIVGAMKSGTSALFDLLVQHPEICPSKIKEPEFFSEHQGHGLDVAKYEDLWDFDPDVHRVALEASTGYAKYPEEPAVPRRIAEAGLNPRFIYLLRDPVDRISSQIAYGAWGRRGAVIDFEDANAVAISKYALQLDRFTEFFPRERILVLSQADLASEPQRVARTVFEFLGLAPIDVATPTEAKNAARPRSGWERRLMRSGRLARVATSAPGPVKSLLRRMSGAGAASKPGMDAATAESLRRLLKADMTRLHDEWGVDVSAWGFDAAQTRGAS